jgi:tRNA A-37 threonylcarbamoyl transferase component Bud32
MISFFNEPDKRLDDPLNHFFKRGRTSTVAMVVIDNRPLVVKRYNIKGLLHGIRRAFMVTRAEHSWKNAKRLKEIGIPTPEPVGYMERRFGPFRNTAYFINEFVEGPRAVDFFRKEVPEEKARVAFEIVKIFNELKSRKISHGDMKATNILVTNGRPSLVDLDAMRIHSSNSRFKRAHRKDVRRFFKNWSDVPHASSLFEELFRKEHGP